MTDDIRAAYCGAHGYTLPCPQCAANFRGETLAQPAPKNCREVPPGNGYCDQCAAGHYERCRYTTSSAAQPAPVQDERIAFEVWAAHFKFDLSRADASCVNEPYANETTDWAWLAWQARAALGAQSVQEVPHD